MHHVIAPLPRTWYRDCYTGNKKKLNLQRRIATTSKDTHTIPLGQKRIPQWKYISHATTSQPT